MTVDYPDYGTPQAHADRIFVTTVPLASKSNVVINDGPTVIAAAGVNSIAPVAIGQIGYEVSFTVLVQAGSITPYCTADLTWTDSASGLIVSHERWTLTGGSASGGSRFTGSGPSKADTLAVAITNQDPLLSATVTTVVTQNSRVYTRDDWRQEAFNNPPTFTLPNHQQQSGILGAFHAVVNAGNSADRLLALYSGLVTVAFNTNAAKGELHLFSTDLGLGGWSGAVAWRIILPANSSDNRQFSLSRGPWSIGVTNTDVGNDVFAWSVIVSEHLA